MSSIIGLHGATGAGKDTVADAMVRTGKFVKLAFADAVKRELVEAFDCPPKLFNDRALKEAPSDDLCLMSCTRDSFIDWYLSTPAGKQEFSLTGACFYSRPRTPRWLMQTWGTDYRKVTEPGYWIRKLIRKMETYTPHHNFVISDVRFEDEAAFVKGSRCPNMICEILRPNNPHRSKTDGHVSNYRLASVDRIILNSGSIESLDRKVDRLLKTFFENNA